MAINDGSSFYQHIPTHIYNYYFTDLRTNTVIAELPLRNVSYTNQLSDAGDLSGSLTVNQETLDLFIEESTRPGKTGIYVVRDDIPVWGGILWKRAYDSKSRTVSITGKTFESYFDHRLQLTTKYWANEDQLEIARWLLSSNNSASAIGMTVSKATSTRRRERTMFSYEFKTTYSELSALAGLLDGFDYNVIIGLDSSKNFTREMGLFYPRRGQSRADTTAVFEHPGAVRSFTITEDAENSGNVVWAIGAGEGSEKVRARTVDSAQNAAGWPMIELTRSYNSVLKPSTLQEHANNDIEQYRTPVTVFEVDVRADSEPALGTYGLGDWARFILEDDFVSPALDTYARITAIEVSVSDSTGLEEVKLTLGGDETGTGEES